MLQIAIWGIAAMLFVKGLDVVHQQRIAEKSGSPGSPVLAALTLIVAVLSAAILIFLAGAQVSSTPSPPAFGM